MHNCKLTQRFVGLSVYPLQMSILHTQLLQMLLNGMIPNSLLCVQYHMREKGSKQVASIMAAQRRLC